MLNAEGAKAYYASKSGLPQAAKFSVSDHAYAYWGAQLGASAPLDIDARELTFLRANTTAQFRDINAARRAYFAQQTGKTGSVAFLARQFFSGAVVTTPTKVNVARVAATIL